MNKNNKTTNKPKFNSYWIYGLISVFFISTYFIGGDSSVSTSKNISISREQIMKKLKEWNIDSRPTFYPLSHMPMFKTVHNPNSETLSGNGINLPSGHNLTEDNIDYICNVIKNILGSH